MTDGWKSRSCNDFCHWKTCGETLPTLLLCVKTNLAHEWLQHHGRSTRKLLEHSTALWQYRREVIITPTEDSFRESPLRIEKAATTLNDWKN